MVLQCRSNSFTSLRNYRSNRTIIPTAAQSKRSKLILDDHRTPRTGAFDEYSGNRDETDSNVRPEMPNRTSGNRNLHATQSGVTSAPLNDRIVTTDYGLGRPWPRRRFAQNGVNAHRLIYEVTPIVEEPRLHPRRSAPPLFADSTAIFDCNLRRSDRNFIGVIHYTKISRQ